MNKFLGFLAIVAVIVAAVSAPVFADSFSTGVSAYAGGVMVGDELVIPVTNGAVLGLTHGNIVLVPYGGENDTTNTITVRTPFQKLGAINIRVSTGATNLVKIASAAGSLDLGTDWIADAGGALSLNVFSTTLASRVNAGQAVPVLTPQRAVVTATAAVTKQTTLIYDSTNFACTNGAGAAAAVVTNATVAVTVVNGGLVVTNMLISLP